MYIIIKFHHYTYSNLELNDRYLYSTLSEALFFCNARLYPNAYYSQKRDFAFESAANIVRDGVRKSH
jgi:hypothetical protein